MDSAIQPLNNRGQAKRGGRVRRTVARISCMRRQKTNGLRAELKKRREQKALLRVKVKGVN